MASLTAIRQRLDTRRRLRKPTGFRFAIADSIALVDATAWDALVAGHSWFMSRDYLSMLESAPPAHIEPRYALIGDARGAFAAVVMQWAEIEGTSLQPLEAPPDDDTSPLQKWLGALAHQGRRAMAAQVHERMLVAGNLLSYGQHAVAMAPDVDPATVWPAVAEALYRVRRAEKMAGQAGFVLIKDLSPAEAKPVAVLADLAYRAVETEPNMVLAIDARWKRYDDYLASLASKYRSSVRQQVLKPIDDAGLQVRGFEITDALAPRLHALYLQVHRNAALRPFTLHEAYFPALQRAAGAHLRCSGVFQGDTLLGFICTLLDGTQAVGYHIGFDRAAGGPVPLYLRLLHASIEQAIDLGARELSFGRTALEPKAGLGARPTPMQVWVRHRHPLFNKITKRMLGLVHHEDAPERNPFKSAAGGAKG